MEEDMHSLVRKQVPDWRRSFASKPGQPCAAIETTRNKSNFMVLINIGYLFDSF